MSDCLRRYRSIRDALKNCYPGEPRGNHARSLNTLAALVSGLLGAQRSPLPKIASQVPDRAKPASRVKRFECWLANDGVSWQRHFLPFIDVVLSSLARQTLVLAIDGSEVGRGNVALMVSVIYHGRALPVAWLVVAGHKGHFPEATHIELLERVQSILADSADVVLLGDGEFDGTDLQARVVSFGWRYVCRTAKNSVLVDADDELRFEDIPLCPGQKLGLADVRVTRHRYGPVLAIGWWTKAQQEPIYWVSNFELVDEACLFYRKRFRIETFFSDQKSRGFHLHKSHIEDPERLSRLLIAACVAYLWIVYLGTLAHRQGWLAIIHRPDRCDLSLFQLGLRLLEFWLNERPEQAISVQFTVPVSPLSPSTTAAILKAAE